MGHLQSECIAVVHFTEIICCNTEITNVLIMFENRIVPSQPKAIAGCDTLVKRNIDTILSSNTQITSVISAFGASRNCVNLSFISVSSIYRKKAAKAWNWFQRQLWRNGTQTAAWNIPSRKTGLHFIFRCSRKFSATIRVQFTFQPDFPQTFFKMTKNHLL